DNGYGVEKDYKQANKMYLRSCNLFDGIACLRLGYNLEHGLGVPEPKIEQSEKYYARACLNGIPEACS
ncbi:MAG: tetratricopeptide repeat protein, partial [Nannocystaceae bacterium]